VMLVFGKCVYRISRLGGDETSPVALSRGRAFDYGVIFVVSGEPREVGSEGMGGSVFIRYYLSKVAFQGTDGFFHTLWLLASLNPLLQCEWVYFFPVLVEVTVLLGRFCG
jgi:hypothetical protein